MRERGFVFREREVKKREQKRGGKKQKGKKLGESEESCHRNDSHTHIPIDAFLDLHSNMPTLTRTITLVEFFHHHVLLCFMSDLQSSTISVMLLLVMEMAYRSSQKKIIIFQLKALKN